MSIDSRPTPSDAAPSVPVWRRNLGRLLRRPVAVISLGLLAIVVVLAIAGEQIAPQGINDVDTAAMLQPPSLAHPFGTDEVGRDILSRIILAARVSVQVSVVSVSIALVAGVALGLVSGFFRGILDTVIMRITDVMFAFPEMLLAMAVVAIMGKGTTSVTIAIAVVYTPIFARVTRASALSVRTETYVSASRSLGAGPARLMLGHVLPNSVAPIIVQTSLSLAFAILSEAALSFLGLGVQQPTPSWGGMLNVAREFPQQWWMAVFPGMAVFLTVLSFNLLGDALRDVLDVRGTAGEERR